MRWLWRLAVSLTIVAAISDETEECQAKGGDSLLSVGKRVKTDTITVEEDSQRGSEHDKLKTNPLPALDKDEFLREKLISEFETTDNLTDPEVTITNDAQGGSTNTGHGMEGLANPFKFLYMKVAELETALEIQGRMLYDQGRMLDDLMGKVKERDQKVSLLEARLQRHRSADRHGEEQGPEPQLQAEEGGHGGDAEHTKAQVELASKLLPEVLKRHAQQRGELPTPAKKQNNVSLADATIFPITVIEAVGQVWEEATSSIDTHVKAECPTSNLPSAAVDDNGLSFNWGEQKCVIRVFGHTHTLFHFNFGTTSMKWPDVKAECPIGTLPSAAVDDKGISFNWGEQKCVIRVFGHTHTLFHFNFGTTAMNWPDVKAECPIGTLPSAAVDDKGFSFNWGEQKCDIRLFGRTHNLFHFNFGTTAKDWPNEVKPMIVMGKNLFECANEGDQAFGCMIGVVGTEMAKHVPPFNYLVKLPEMVSELIQKFARVAANIISDVMEKHTSLIQTAAESKFPEEEDGDRLFHHSNNFKIHMRTRGRRSLQQLPRNQQPAALQQRDQLNESADLSGGDGMGDGPVGAVSLGAGSGGAAPPYMSMLMTQFGGVEVDSASCLAFAPAHRRRSDGKVTQRDWQTPSNTGDADFIKLEPWAVPCDNQWMKDNYQKWEGYSFYRYESNIEKCVDVSFEMSTQPVIAFVGGLQFDLLPGPLAEVHMEVCWPDKQPGGLDLSLVSTTIKSAGISLMKHTMRLKRRFGSNTDFTSGNLKESVSRLRNELGKGWPNDDDKGIDALSRSASLSQSAMSEAREPQPESQDEAEKGEEEEEEAEGGFEIDHEYFELASAKYDDNMGIDVFQRLTGTEAGRLLRKLMRSAEPGEPDDTVGELGVLQQNQSVEGTAQVHDLFVLEPDNDAPIKFKLTGQLSQGKFQMKVYIQFGPFKLPERTIDLLDFSNLLDVVLAAVPHVSSKSRIQAVDALRKMEEQQMEQAMPLTVSRVYSSSRYNSPVEVETVKGASVNAATDHARGNLYSNLGSLYGGLYIASGWQKGTGAQSFVVNTDVTVLVAMDTRYGCRDCNDVVPTGFISTGEFITLTYSSMSVPQLLYSKDFSAGRVQFYFRKNHLIAGIFVTYPGEVGNQWETLYEASSNGVKLNETDFNRVFRQTDRSGIIRRECSGCAKSHKDVYIKVEQPSSWNAYQELLVTWSGSGFKTKFNIYSSLPDALAGRDAWQWCNGGHTNVGFPRDCGPTSPGVSGQWNGIAKGRTTGYKFSAYKTATSELPNSWPGASACR